MNMAKWSTLTDDEKWQLVEYSRLNKQSKLLFEIMCFGFIGLRSRKDNGITLAKTRREIVDKGKITHSTVYTITVKNEEGD